MCSSALDGTAFLETMNLDGETNLKLREAPEVTHKELTRASTDDSGNECCEVDVAKVRVHVRLGVGVGGGVSVGVGVGCRCRCSCDCARASATVLS